MAALHTSNPPPPLSYRAIMIPTHTAAAALPRHNCASELPFPLRSKLNPPLHGPPPSSIFCFVFPHPSSKDPRSSIRIPASATSKNDSAYSLIREESTQAEKKDSPSSQDGSGFVANRYGDSKDLQIDTELPDVSGSFESLNNCTDLIDGDGRKLTWFQYGFINTVRPLIRVVNGSNLKDLSLGNERKKKKNKKLQRSEADDLRTSWSFVKMLTGSWPPSYHRRKIRRRLRQAEADFFTFTSHLGKFLFTMMATGTVLATGYELAGGDSELETVIWLSWLAGIIVGSMIGAEKVMQKRFRSGPRNVIITGSTRGLGKALAREFLLAGDRVVIASRSPESVAETVEELQVELASRLYHPFSMVHDSLSLKDRKDGARVIGIACDVSKVNDVKALAEFAGSELGSIDLWINNAGINKGFRPLTQFSDDDIQEIVSANMIGSLICTREAIRVMKLQRKGGHIFNMDGAGSGGSSTPLTAVYGATKCGLRQLHGSLLKECKGSRVGIHTASPGMVLTDLLLSGASLQNKKMFNIICELPETVARTLVPRMRDIKGTGKAINFLTPPRILLALVTAWLRRGRWFDEEGRAVYAAEADRLRNWAEDRARLPVSAAIEQFSDTTLVSVFSITVICAFIMLESGISGT